MEQVDKFDSGRGPLTWQDGTEMTATTIRKGGKTASVLAHGTRQWVMVVDKCDDGYWWRMSSGNPHNDPPEYFGPYPTLEAAQAVALVSYRFGG